MGKPIVWPWMASVLKDEQLGLANLPPDAPVTVLLNKTPATGSIRRRAQLIASLLLRSSRIDAVVIGEMQAFRNPVHEVRKPVAAVVLAAGKSSRMGGKSKVLLPWGKQTVLEAIIRQLFMCRLDRVVIVTGRDAVEARRVASPYDVEVVYNPDYEAGEMLSSLQVGLNALDQRYDGALVVLGDQPQMQAHVVSRILDAYAEGRGGIIIPSFQMRRGHPVLFSRGYWPVLQGLPPGSVPRDVVNASADDIGYVEVSTDTILQDIDTPEQYRSALRRMGLA
jgi:molybdenum cofactor cytidylyltransferase